MDNPHYVTPQDAKNMKCPMSFNAVTTDDDHYLCLGPKCMAWRWAKLPDMTDDGKIRLDPVYSTAHGYCGMVKS